MNTHNIYLSATTNILIKFTDDSDGNIWYLKNGYIMNKKYKSFLYLNKNKLMLSKTKKNIIYFNDRLKHKNNELYLSTCYNYKIKFVPDRINSIHISNEFIDNTYFKLYYTKTQLELDFYKNNISMDINLNTGTQNIAVLLCAGTSSRFSSNIPKQLFIIDNLSVIEKCIISFNNTNIFKIILVTNSNIYEQIRDIVKKYNNIDILINDINCRLESIHTAIKYIKTTYDSRNIFIHDSSRPYINETHVTRLLKYMNTYVYSHYYVKITNGLIKKESHISEPVERDNYYELCTPVCCNFNLYFHLFTNYISKNNRITSEIIPLLDILKMKYILICESDKYLKKITYISDI